MLGALGAALSVCHGLLIPAFRDLPAHTNPGELLIHGAGLQTPLLGCCLPGKVFVCAGLSRGLCSRSHFMIKDKPRARRGPCILGINLMGSPLSLLQSHNLLLSVMSPASSWSPGDGQEFPQPWVILTFL